MSNGNAVFSNFRLASVEIGLNAIVMATKVSTAKGSPAKLRLDVGVNLLGPLQGPKSSAGGKGASVKLLDPAEWCKAERTK